MCRMALWVRIMMGIVVIALVGWEVGTEAQGLQPVEKVDQEMQNMGSSLVLDMEAVDFSVTSWTKRRLTISEGQTVEPVDANRASVIEVGTSPLCAYHSVEAAIAAAKPGDTIKIENTLFVENPLVVSKDLTLAGSYNSAHPYSCLTLTGYAWTTLQRVGTVSAPILRVQNATVTVTWIRFQKNGHGSGIVVEDGELFLENSIVEDNDAKTGGGLWVHGGWLHLTDTEVLGNTADLGGGMYAESGSHIVTVRSNVQDNQGFTKGAGLYLTGGSELVAYDGTLVQDNRTMLGCEDGGGIYASGVGTSVYLDASSVFSNTALYHGGGMYVGSGASSTIVNGSQVAHNISYGPATGGGGGAYVSGGSSSLEATNSYFYDNWADPRGAGIYNDGATVRLNGVWLVANNVGDSGGGLYAFQGETCIWESVFYDNKVQRLNGAGLSLEGTGAELEIEGAWFIDNQAVNGSGGAIHAEHESISIRRSYISDNTASGDGSALHFVAGLSVAPPVVEVVNCYIVDNVTTAAQTMGPPVIGSSIYAESATISLVHNTIASESAMLSAGVQLGPDSRIKMGNNIISNFSLGIKRPLGGTGLAVADHTLFYGNFANYDVSGITSTNEVLGNPAFLGAGDYHLSSGSAAINNGTDAGVYVDYDGSVRPWAGGFDIGADEFPPLWQIYAPVVSK